VQRLRALVLLLGWVRRWGGLLLVLLVWIGILRRGLRLGLGRRLWRGCGCRCLWLLLLLHRLDDLKPLSPRGPIRLLLCRRGRRNGGRGLSIWHRSRICRCNRRRWWWRIGCCRLR
jgi:hypothetical protein